jgi:quinol monooxygenase YgiN
MNIIHAHLKIKPEKRDEFLKVVKPLVEGSQAEEGNIRYELYESTTEPNTFVVLEEWKDMDAIKFHNETSHFKEWGRVSSDYLASTPVVSVFEATKKN